MSQLQLLEDAQNVLFVKNFYWTAALEDEDSGVRSRAAYALGELSKASEKVVTALLGLLEDEDSGVRSSAASALGTGNASERVIAALLGRLEDEDLEVRFSAVFALGCLYFRQVGQYLREGGHCPAVAARA
ncbi:MAG: HEAT repeat domain-containing protein [Xenococcaceae cyanobacterium]